MLGFIRALYPSFGPPRAPTAAFRETPSIYQLSSHIIFNCFRFVFKNSLSKFLKLRHLSCLLPTANRLFLCSPTRAPEEYSAGSTSTGLWNACLLFGTNKLRRGDDVWPPVPVESSQTCPPMQPTWWAPFPACCTWQPHLQPPLPSSARVTGGVYWTVVGVRTKNNF